MFLILSWPYFNASLRRRKDTVHLIVVALFGAFLCLGKVSTGLSFMAILGLYYFLDNPRDLRVWLLGIFWTLFLIFYSKAFSPSFIVEEDFSIVLYFTLFKYSFVILCISCFVAFRDQESACRTLIIPMTLWLIILLSISWKVTRIPDNWFYFNQGFMLIGSLVFLSSLSKLKIEQNVIKFKLKSQKLLFFIKTYSVWLTVTIFVLAFFSFVPIFQVKKNFEILNVYPFKNAPKRNLKITDKTIKNSFGNIKKFQKFLPVLDKTNDLIIFKEALNEFAEMNQIHKAPIFLNKDLWNDMENSIPPFVENDLRWKQDINWMVALGFASFVSFPILNGVPDKYPLFYGFDNYRGRGLRVADERSVDCLNYQRFIKVVSFKDPSFEIVDCN